MDIVNPDLESTKMYRQFVIFKLPQLKTLDSTLITHQERDRARRTGKYSLTKTPSKNPSISPSSLSSLTSTSDSNRQFQAYQQAPPPIDIMSGLDVILHKQQQQEREEEEERKKIAFMKQQQQQQQQGGGRGGGEFGFSVYGEEEEEEEEGLFSSTATSSSNSKNRKIFVAREERRYDKNHSEGNRFITNSDL